MKVNSQEPAKYYIVLTHSRDLVRSTSLEGAPGACRHDLGEVPAFERVLSRGPRRPPHSAPVTVLYDSLVILLLVVRLGLGTVPVAAALDLE